MTETMMKSEMTHNQILNTFTDVTVCTGMTTMPKTRSRSVIPEVNSAPFCVLFMIFALIFLTWCYISGNAYNNHSIAHKKHAHFLGGRNIVKTESLSWGTTAKNSEYHAELMLEFYDVGSTNSSNVKIPAKGEARDKDLLAATQSAAGMAVKKLTKRVRQR